MSCYPVIITELSQHPEWLDQLVGWHHAEWLTTVNHALMSSAEIEKAKSDRKSFMQSHITSEGIPITFLGVINGMPIGSASLIHHLQEQNLNSIWLTNVFVVPEHRRKGIAEQLIHHALQYCCTHHYKWVQLYTFDAADYYLKRGWEYARTCRIRGREVDILKINTVHQRMIH